MSQLQHNIEQELVTRRIQTHRAQAAISKEEKEAQKEKRQVPGFLMSRLVAEVAYCKANERAAEASLAGVRRYPPVGDL